MKNALIIAGALILLGAILFAGAAMRFGWDFSKLSAVNYETAVHTPMVEYKHITLKTDTADITFAPSENGETKIVCYEEQNAKHIVSVEDETLSISLRSNKKWYEYIGIHFDTPKITVYIPQGEYGALTVRTSTGNVQLPADFSFASVDIQVSTGHISARASAESIKLKADTGGITLENISANALEVTVSTGRAELTNINCQSFTSTGSTGDLFMENVIAEEGFFVERSTGDVEFTRCDAREITVNTVTGHIRGSLLSDKVFLARTDTGRVDVPNTATGGKCQLTTDTGNIKIEIVQ